MLINPAAIVAFLVYLIAGPLAISQRFQTRFKSLGHGVHQKISSVLSLPYTSLEPQDYSVALETTIVQALPIAPVETNVVHPVEILPSCPVPLEDHDEIVFPEVCSTRYDDRPSPDPVRAFVVASEYHGPFDWRDLFDHRVLYLLIMVYVSICFPLVVIPLVFKLLPRSESSNKAMGLANAQRTPLPPKVLTTPPTVHIRLPHALPEPTFPPAPPEPSAFWFVSEQKEQHQPSSSSPSSFRFLGLLALENGSELKLSPLSSPADSGYGTTLPDATSDPSSAAPENGFTTTPEHPVEPLPTAGAESTFVHSFESATVTGEIDTAGLDTEPEDSDDDDDGSTTVTNSIANLTNLISRPTSAPAEELVTRLESVTAIFVDEAEPFPKPPAEELSVTVSSPAVDLPSHDEPNMDPPFDDQPATDLGTFTQESATEEDDEIPTIVISPPSEVDPEDFAQQLDLEEEQEDTTDPNFEDELEPEPEYEESEHDDNSEPERADYPAHWVNEVVSNPAEVRDDPCRSPCRSPITVTGMLWSDDNSDDLGPLPFTEEIIHVEETDTPETDTSEPSDTAETAKGSEIDILEQTEAQGSTAEEEISENVMTTLQDLDLEEPVIEAAQGPVEEPQPALQAPAQEVVEPAPAIPVLPPNPSHNPTRAPRLDPIRTRVTLNGEDRGEGSSRNGRTLESPRLQYFHCCKLYRSDGRPKSWENWKFEKPEVCIPAKTHLQTWQFVCPTDKDGQNPTTRIAIDNLDADWFRLVEGIPSYNYLTEAMGFFSTRYFRCWRGRTINGVEYSSIGYATVDFNSLDEAVRMFDELQGKRLRGHTWHWRLEFINPGDDTHGGRKVIRTDLVPDSVKQALAAELEASTRRHGRPSSSDDSSTDAPIATRPPARVRPQLSIGARSLFSGAVANAVQDRRIEEKPVQPMTRASHRRPYRS